MKLDGDFAWLLSHIPPRGSPNIHEERVQKVEELIADCITRRSLPYTLGLFGTWGCGKTTFLSLLAKRLSESPAWRERCNVIYFNAWKYAGFLEIVPSLIYKVLKYGAAPTEEAERVTAKIMLSLGKEYSDKVGQWVEKHLGLDPVKLFKEIQAALREAAIPVPQEVLHSYYTQVDQAQDLLRKVFQDNHKATVVLIDELDRCDPDEAFAVIKQLRVFFAMREVPLLFLICANPEPIGLAIKHRYGLDSPTSDYEAKRILEKFVDTYVDMSEPLLLGPYIKALWRGQRRDPAGTSLIAALDEQYPQANYHADTVKNATPFQAMKTDNPIYANLRLLRKSLEYVCSHSFPNKHLLWTAWHLEMAEQMDEGMRRSIAAVSSEIRDITRRAYEELFAIHYRWITNPGKPPRILLETDKGKTLFGAFRSLYWEFAKQRVDELESEQGSQAAEMKRILSGWLTDYRRMDFVVLMSLLPFGNAADRIRHSGHGHGDFRAFAFGLTDDFINQYGWLLANY